MSASHSASRPGARRGRVAFGCSAASLVLQPIAIVVAIRGDAGDRTAGIIVVDLSVAALAALVAVVAGASSLLRLRGAPDSERLAGLLGLVLGVLAGAAVIVVGIVALLIASKGGWIYMS